MKTKQNLIKISAVSSQIQFSCGHCSVSVLLGGGLSTRGFARQLNKFKKEHEWKCFYAARDKKILAESSKTMGDLMARLATKATK